MNHFEFDKEVFRRRIVDLVKLNFLTTIDRATTEQIYTAVCWGIKEQIIDAWTETRQRAEDQDVKMLYYMSMEFLMGRALGNNIINIEAMEGVKEVLADFGVDLNLLEDQERDWALGNGGLGRLAACFLDSLATLGYHAYGCGIRYKYGMFKQKIENGKQIEVADDWLNHQANPFEVRRSENRQLIKFGGQVQYSLVDGRPTYTQVGYQSVWAVPYDMPVIGYGNGVVNTLRIWSAEPVKDLDLESFGRGDYENASKESNLAETLCKVLYPADNHYAGKELRLKQQYFFVSATVQRAVYRYMQSHDDIHKLYEKVTFQMNDTHPTVTVAELMRILLDDYKLEWDEAWEITKKTCAYTNHTIMAEALEKWPIDLFQRLLPRVYQIIDEINKRFNAYIRKTYPGNLGEEKIETMAVLFNGQVRMANLAIVGGYSVNGVAALHTEILKKRELKDFYELYPEKFNNKTNGITQRRFLLHGNPELAAWITGKIGNGWITNLSELKKLEPLADDPQARAEFRQIKYNNKLRLAAYIKENNGIDVDPNSIFDVQVKRLHEYKRQLLNIMHVMHLYNQLKDNPDLEMQPRTFIFGAKAAAGYVNAKLTIKLINNVAKVINNDDSINGKLKVVFIEDYRVSNAEIIFPASDVSEQISTASKEASGTGNMKFMLNGALTLGTMDGANVEIVQEAGAENAFIFGLSSDEVMEFERNNRYNPYDIYNNDADIRRVMEQMINGYYCATDLEQFRPLYNSLLNTYNSSRPDTYFILKDFRSYEEAQKKINAAYADQEAWSRSAIINVANAGKFSSDRTIQEYVDDIWHLDKLDME